METFLQEYIKCRSYWFIMKWEAFKLIIGRRIIYNHYQQCFMLILFFHLFLKKYCSMSSLNINPFPQTANLQQATLKMFCSRIWEISLIVGKITEQSWKNCGKRRNWSFWSISPFVTMFSVFEWNSSWSVTFISYPHIPFNILANIFFS